VSGSYRFRWLLLGDGEIGDVLQNINDLTCPLDIEDFADVMAPMRAIDERTKTCSEFALTVAVG